MGGPVTGRREAVRRLNPGYFALVMASGIVSVAMDEHGQRELSLALLWLGCVAYALLIVLTGWRIAAFPREVTADVRDPRRAFLLFTFVAATNVLGTRLLIDHHRSTALVLLVIGWLAWLVLGYLVPWTAVLGHTRPILRDANGSWFIWVVASQSVAVLAATLEPSFHEGRRWLALLAVFSWSVGVFLYAATGLFVAARLMLYPLTPQDLTPPYWVAMGAAAITVVAGAKIVQMADAPTVAAIHGLAVGTSVVFWAFGSWLIPALVAAGVWRHVVHRIPLRYEPTLWSVVFPLGMYAVASDFLGQADRLPIATAIGTDEGWVAFAAWLATLVAMLHQLARSLIAVRDT